MEKVLQSPSGSIEPISKASKAHTIHLLVMSFIIIGSGIAIFFVLQSFNLLEEKKFDEAWCKSLLSKHDPSVLGMTFSESNGVKTNFTVIVNTEGMKAEAVSILVSNGTVEECSLEAITNTGLDLLSPVTYSCVNDTSYRLSSKETDSYLYFGRGITYSMSSNMMRERARQLNLTRNFTGFVYVDTISYRATSNRANHEAAVAEANAVVNKFCTVNE